jgi:hypothetical protein
MTYCGISLCPDSDQFSFRFIQRLVCNVQLLIGLLQLTQTVRAQLSLCQHGSLWMQQKSRQTNPPFGVQTVTNLQQLLHHDEFEPLTPLPWMQVSVPRNRVCAHFVTQRQPLLQQVPSLILDFPALTHLPVCEKQPSSPKPHWDSNDKLGHLCAALRNAVIWSWS